MRHEAVVLQHIPAHLNSGDDGGDTHNKVVDADKIMTTIENGNKYNDKTHDDATHTIRHLRKCPCVSSQTHISSECEPANISAAYDLRPSHPNRAVHCQSQVSFAHIGPRCRQMQPLLTRQINVTTSGGSQTQCRMRK